MLLIGQNNHHTQSNFEEDNFTNITYFDIITVFEKVFYIHVIMKAKYLAGFKIGRIIIISIELISF